MQFLDRQTLLAGGIVGTIAVTYLVINFRFPTVWLRLPAKEIFVGFLFAFGTGLVVLTRIPALSAVAIFGALCSLNCLSIACWERQLDAAQCKISVAAANLNLSRYIGGIAIVVVVAALALVLVDRRFMLFGLCIAASTVLLVALHAPGRLPTDERTAMADLALLTPLPFLLFT